MEKNARLAEDVEKARMDKLDIIEYLREEEAKKKFQLTELQRTLKETTDEKDGRIQQLADELAATKESSNEKIEDLTEQIAVVERQLDTLKQFEQEKAKMDAKLKTLNEQIMREQIQHRESIRNLERCEFGRKFAVIHGSASSNGSVLSCTQAMADRAGPPGQRREASDRQG